MSTKNSPDPADLVTHVVEAFQRMHVPSGPSVPETIESLERRKETAGTLETRAGGFAQLTRKHRFAVGGLGVSAVAGLLLLLVTMNSGRQLSAMERMTQELRQVTSYSYQMSTRATQRHATGSTTWKGDGPTYWHAPDAFRDEQKIVKIDETIPPGERSVEILEHFAQIFPAGKSGIFIDYKRKTYFPQRFEPTGSRTYPLELLKLIREGSAKATRDLGTKKIGGRKARGYVVPVESGAPAKLHNVEVWVDAQTDLPLEFGYEVTDAKQRWSTVLRVTDFRWNIELDSKFFEPKPPEGYIEVDSKFFEPKPPEGYKEVAPPDSER